LTEIFLRAPATIANFGPGFDIFALALAEPCDVFRIRRTKSKKVTIAVVGDRDNLPTEAEKNTAGVAALVFLKRLKAPAGVEIEIIKKIPAGAGLGSSGASAVAAVYGLDKLFKTGLDVEDRLEIASRGEEASSGASHADNVSACGLGGFVLIRNRHPLRFDRIEVPDIPIVMRIQKKSMTTSRSLIPGHLSLAGVKEQMAWCAALVHALHTGDLKKIGEAISRDHISEPVRSRYIPGYEDLKKRALEAGALGCNVSGGGSSVFAICDKDRVDLVAEVLGARRETDPEPPLVLKTKSANQGVTEIDGL